MFFLRFGDNIGQIYSSICLGSEFYSSTLVNVFRVLTRETRLQNNIKFKMSQMLIHKYISIYTVNRSASSSTMPERKDMFFREAGCLPGMGLIMSKWNHLSRKQASNLS